MLQFPKEHEAWKKFVHAELKAQLTDIQRLWKRLPQRPDDPSTFIGGVTGIDIGTFDGTRGTINTGQTGGTNTFNTFNTGGTNTFNTGGTVNTGGTNTFATFALSCGLCSSTPVRWKVTVAGITNGTCSQCSGYNGTFTLHHVGGSACQWKSTETVLCPSSGTSAVERFALSYSAILVSWVVVIQGAGVSLAEYRLASASFNCMGSNTLTRVGATSGNCATYPTTVLVQPG